MRRARSPVTNLYGHSWRAVVVKPAFGIFDTGQLYTVQYLHITRPLLETLLDIGLTVSAYFGPTQSTSWMKSSLASECLPKVLSPHLLHSAK